MWRKTAYLHRQGIARFTHSRGYSPFVLSLNTYVARVRCACMYTCASCMCTYVCLPPGTTVPTRAYMHCMRIPTHTRDMPFVKRDNCSTCSYHVLDAHAYIHTCIHATNTFIRYMLCGTYLASCIIRTRACMHTNTRTHTTKISYAIIIVNSSRIKDSPPPRPTLCCLKI